MTTEHVQAQILQIVSDQLRGDYSDSLTRFSYLNGGAYDFVCMAHAPDYLGNDREIRLVSAMALEIRQRIPCFGQIIELGPGDGAKAATLIERMDRRSVAYTGLDISQEMLRIARQTFDGRDLSGDFEVCDWHDPSCLDARLRKNNGRAALVLFFGNTLTNEISVGNYLVGLRKTLDMTPSNRLMVGLETFDGDPHEIVKEYRTESNYTLTVRPLEMIGINTRACSVDIFFNEKTQRIEEWFVSNATQEIRLLGFHLSLHRGTKILTSVTYKYALEEILRIFAESGWRVERSSHESSQWMFLLAPMRKVR